MPSLQRPGGVEIHWEERGEGPLVLFLSHCLAHPGVYQGLIDELARDHRVVTYDPRGAGKSSRKGPYDVSVDVQDLEALVRELDGGAVAVGLGDGRDLAARVAHAHPDLIEAVVGCDASPVIQAMGELETPSASQSVLEAVVGLAGSNLRVAVRSILEFTNPAVPEDEMRERIDALVAYWSPEAVGERAQWFVRKDAIAVARSIGDRLWIAFWESVWAPPGVAARVRELLPEARLHPVGGGPISRPDLTAAVVRQAVAQP